MTTINFDQVFKELTSGVKSLAKDSLKDYEKEAKADGQKALNNMKSNLQQWAKEVETGTITKEDLGFLLKEEEGLTEMTALKQAGLAAIHIDQFRNGVINMIVGTITGLIKV
jgi:hypothetical protein